MRILRDGANGILDTAVEFECLHVCFFQFLPRARTNRRCYNSIAISQQVRDRLQPLLLIELLTKDLRCPCIEQGGATGREFVHCEMAGAAEVRQESPIHVDRKCYTKTHLHPLLDRKVVRTYTGID
jgi:hypothetical protein